MPTTLLPFLYQTRTLQRHLRNGISTPDFRALVHSISAPRESRRTPQRSHRARRGSGNAIPFELPPDMEHRPQRTESGEISTITPQEQKTFDRIFKEIAARGLSSSSRKASTASSQAESDVHTFEGEANKELTPNNISIILQNANAASSKSWRPMIRHIDPLNPAGRSAAVSGQSKTLHRFPPSLRKAAREALGVFEAERGVEGYTQEGEGGSHLWSKSESGAAAPEEHVSSEPTPSAPGLEPAKLVEEEPVRREERTRVENKMRAAQSDFELWDVLEQEVFTMVDKLGMDGKTKQNQKPQRRRKRREEIATGPDETSQGKLSINIHGPLYPFYLLTALRLLDQAFVRSSPLALNILPRVRELGTMSYVLGVSTPFYNALAEIYWSRYGNPEAVFNIFEEMRQAGLYYDEATLSLIRNIKHTLTAGANGAMGPFVEELLSLPEYEFTILPAITNWSSTISGQVQERSHDSQLIN